MSDEVGRATDAVNPNASDLSEDERKALELEKLRLETESLRRRRDLEVEKLQNEIAEMKKAPLRAMIFSSATILLGLGTFFLGWAGFAVNGAVNNATTEQRDFETYGKLTEE